MSALDKALAFGICLWAISILVQEAQIIRLKKRNRELEAELDMLALVSHDV